MLLATSVGGYLNGLTLETALAVSLRLRGAAVETVLCDSDLPACMECSMQRMITSGHMRRNGPQKTVCPGCFAAGEKTYSDLRVPIHRYGDFLTPKDRRECAAIAGSIDEAAIANLVVDGVHVGEHAVAGALRFFARATLGGEPDGEPILRRYLDAALLSARAVARLLSRGAYDVVVSHHGIYVPQGLVGEVARAAGVRVVNWNPAYRSKCFIFSHDDTYHKTMMTEPKESWQDLSLDHGQREALFEYLRSRWTGAADWIWYHERPESELKAIAAQVGVDFGRPVIGLLTNVMWDAQLHYSANAFANMRDWVLGTINYFASRPDLQLLIRVHPAEIRGTLPSRQPIVDEIRSAYPRLPENVFIIPPESSVSTYAAMLECDTVLIYGTKTGVELTAVGIPVVVAGEAWIRNKGITSDASSPAEYEALLDDLPRGDRLDGAVKELAEKYAYHFFFRRMIPLEFVEPAHGDPVFKLNIKGTACLAEGASPGLDVICSGILHGTPFIFPAERMARRG